MGVTIHFEGSLKSRQAFDELADIAIKFANERQFAVSTFHEDNKLLQRVRNEQDWDYQGPTDGILIHASEACDPINLEFDENLHLQEYCKTQFAGCEIHILICALLRLIEPFFANLQVYDEAEYWETGDRSILETHLEKVFEMIEEAKNENGKLDGPFRVNGRIVDLIEK